MSPAIVCLAVGILIGPLGFALLDATPREHGRLIESVTEVALVLALFCVGLRLRAPLEWAAWRGPVRLATVASLATAALAAGAAHVFFDLTFAQSVLLGAVLAPTDPVLASEVQMPADGGEGGRFALEAEGALNTGIGQALLALGLGLLGLNGLGPFATKWVVLDALWLILGACALGWLVGAAAARWLVRLERERAEPPEELFAVGALLLAYAAAMALHASGFLAVFAAGLAFGRGGRWHRAAVERRLSRRLLATAARLEQLAVLGVVVLLGAMLALVEIRLEMLFFALLLLAVIRPVAVQLAVSPLAAPGELRVIEWFGVRGIASVFLLVHVLNHGLSTAFARELTAITLVALVSSIVLHGLSATPLVSRRADQRS